MKRLFYIFLLVSSSCLAQLPESNIPEVSNKIIGEFITEAHDRSWYPDEHLNQHLKGVYFIPKYRFKRFTGETSDGRAGCLVPHHNYLMNRLEMMVLIDSKYLEQPEDLKAFVFHELGHFFGLAHDDSEPGVMNSKINGSILTPYHIEIFFRKLKNIPPADYRATIDLNKK